MSSSLILIPYEFNIETRMSCMQFNRLGISGLKLDSYASGKTRHAAPINSLLRFLCPDKIDPESHKVENASAVFTNGIMLPMVSSHEHSAFLSTIFIEIPHVMLLDSSVRKRGHSNVPISSQSEEPIAA